MRKFTLALSAIGLWLTLGSAVAQASAPSPISGDTEDVKLAGQAPIHWISVAELESTLTERPPMSVGFDIDDTVIFSGPGFWRGKKTWSPDSEEYLQNPAFWEQMNNGGDEFSIPKEVARQLIAMHVKRGDSIYFITGRSPTKTETISKTLQEIFLIPGVNMNPVIFASDKPGHRSKAQWMQAKQIRIFYGVSDYDIASARASEVRPIRILPASYSSTQPPPQAGALGEEVLVNSEY
ncbi:acid phosphatase AphA [Vagococcus sp. WN89Y]|uniref:acid phosphatase AphA n=1 Tax=Vagococcus sp. WN89Y TaxID=3457258 RepID=UPI003FCCD8A9